MEKNRKLNTTKPNYCDPHYDRSQKFAIANFFVKWFVQIFFIAFRMIVFTKMDL